MDRLNKEALKSIRGGGAEKGCKGMLNALSYNGKAYAKGLNCVSSVTPIEDPIVPAEDPIVPIVDPIEPTEPIEAPTDPIGVFVP